MKKYKIFENKQNLIPVDVLLDINDCFITLEEDGVLFYENIITSISNTYYYQKIDENTKAKEVSFIIKNKKYKFENDPTRVDYGFILKQEQILDILTSIKRTIDIIETFNDTDFIGNIEYNIVYKTLEGFNRTEEVFEDSLKNFIKTVNSELVNFLEIGIDVEMFQMNHVKKFKVFESMVDKKNQLIEDLSNDLKDNGLTVEIWKKGKQINCFIQDETLEGLFSDDYYNSDPLINYDIIQEFIKDLKSYGLKPREISSAEDKVWLKFDKWGKMTKSPYLYESLVVNNNYSIYDFFEDLKVFNWGTKDYNNSFLKKWSNHFIGDKAFENIINISKKICESLKKVDMDYVNDRLLEVWDELPNDKEKYASIATTSKSYQSDKYNQLTMAKDLESLEKRLVLNILIDIIYPTLFIGHPSINLRITKEQIYVTDKKWQCSNFNVNDYIKPGTYHNGRRERRKTTIFEHTIKEKEKYNFYKILNSHKPCILIIVDNMISSFNTTFKVSHIQNLLDEVLPTILPELDYEKVIWDGVKKFDSDIDIYDYKLKILLKI